MGKGLERDCYRNRFNSLLAIHKILKADIGLDHHRALIADCRTFLKKPWKVSIQHVLREGNSFDYILANWAMSLQVDMQVWETSPVFVRAQLDADKIGFHILGGCAM